MAKRQRRLIFIRPGFLVLTAKGLEFVETWFGASGRVPPHLTKLYQLLLRQIIQVLNVHCMPLGLDIIYAKGVKAKNVEST